MSNPDLQTANDGVPAFRPTLEFSGPGSHLHWVEWQTGRIEAATPAIDHVHINVVRAGRGRLFRSDALGAREDAFRPGHVNLTLPGADGGVVALDRDRGSLTAHQRRCVQALVEARMGEDLAVLDMAQTAGIGPRHFSRLFRNSLGISPCAYVLERRLLAARRQIRSGGAPITEVALTCGFGSAAALSAAYKRRVEVRPGEDRRLAIH